MNTAVMFLVCFHSFQCNSLLTKLTFVIQAFQELTVNCERSLFPSPTLERLEEIIHTPHLKLILA